MSGYNAFADPLPIRERLFELSVEDREWHSGCDRVNAYTRVEE